MMKRASLTAGTAQPVFSGVVKGVLLAFILAALAACMCVLPAQKAHAAEQGLAVGSVQATTQDDQYIRTLWAGSNMPEYASGIEAPEDAVLVSVKSSNPSVIKAVNLNESAYSVRLYPLKPGTSTITITYSAGGKTTSASIPYKVKAFPKPFKSIKLNGVSLEVPSSKNLQALYDIVKFKGTGVKVDVVLEDGWTMGYMDLDTMTVGKNDYSFREIKSGKSYSIGAKQDGIVGIDVRNENYDYFRVQINLHRKEPITLMKGGLYAGYTGRLGFSSYGVEDAKITKVTSSNPKVLKAKKSSRLEKVSLKGLKAGKSKVTVTYKYRGNTYKTSAVYTVKKYPNPLKSVKVNGKKVKLKKYPASYYVTYNKDSAKVKVAPNKGWKVKSIKAYGGASKKGTKVKNGGTVSTPKGSVTYVQVKMKKGGKKFTYYMGFIR